LLLGSRCSFLIAVSIFLPPNQCRVSKIMRMDRHVEPKPGPMGDAKIRRVKAPFDCDPWDSAKERGPKGYAFAGTWKADFWALRIV